MSEPHQLGRSNAFRTCDLGLIYFRAQYNDWLIGLSRHRTGQVCHLPTLKAKGAAGERKRRGRSSDYSFRAYLFAGNDFKPLQ